MMTPQEKAEELFDKYATYAVMWTGGIEVEKQNCKQCALIAVDEIIKVACDESDYDEAVTKLYWNEVKEEIEKL
jgi:hypothetical protein